MAIGPSSARAIAIKAEIGPTSLRDYLAGDTEPSMSAVVALAEATGVSIEWLATGLGDARPTTRLAAAESPGMANLHSASDYLRDQGYALVPLYDVHAAAGDGSFVDDEHVLDELAFRTEWIRRELGAEVNDLLLVFVRGDSMSGKLEDGDVIMVDKRDRRVTRDGVYVIRQGDAIQVKNLQRLPGNIIKVWSEAPGYDPFTFNLDDRHAAVHVIGRVVWRAGRV